MVKKPLLRCFDSTLNNGFCFIVLLSFYIFISVFSFIQLLQILPNFSACQYRILFQERNNMPQAEEQLPEHKVNKAQKCRLSQ